MQLVERRVAMAPRELYRRTRSLLLAAASLFLMGIPLAEAQDGVEPRVARVSFVEGDASYLNADADEWTAVDVNAPLVTGDRFYSGSDGRAEIQLPGGVYARLASATEIDLLEVSSQATHVRVGIGTATFRLRDVPAGQHVEFSTPTTALVARSRGVYRVDVAEDGQTTVQVREGEADAYLGDERYRLERGRGARIVDAAYVQDGSPIEVFDATSMQNDPWDDWEVGRAQRVQKAASYEYVDDEVYGVEDLDEYGTWDRHQEYGPIWRPTQVAASWAPYTEGRWVWQDPWGWTWVDYQPWGWAPSHYGRWVYVQDYWAWAPGPVVARPVYAPATVGFLGVSVNTPSVSVSVGIGPSVGWVPLGYGEPIIPWWRGVGGVSPGRPWWGGWGGPRIVNNTVINKNVTNINVTNINYTNLERRGGFNAVSRDSFVRGDLQRLDLPQGRLRDIAKPLRGAPEIIPQRESLFAARPEKLRKGRGAEPPREVLQRAALSTRAVPAPRPGFAEKVKLIERDKGAPVAPNQLRQLARGQSERASQVKTIAARGKKPVVPEVTAQAPTRPNEPLQRRAAAPGQNERRADESRADDRRAAGEARGPGQPRDGADPRTALSGAAPGDARSALPGADAGRAAPNERKEKGRDGQQAQVERPDARQAGQRDARQATGERAGDARNAAAPSRGARAQDPSAEGRREMRQALDAPERGRQDGSAAVGSAQPEDGGRRAAVRPGDEPAARQQRDAAEQQRGERERQQREQLDRTQREQSERTQREASAQREAAQQRRVQEDRAQREQAERVQREQTERTQREASAQREAAQQRRVQEDRAQREQTERVQRDQAERTQRQQAERQQVERTQRDAAARQQREAAEQQQRSQVERQQRQQAERAQRDAAAQQERRAAEQQQRSQAERQQRQQAERAQRDAAAQQQRQADQQQRSQAERQQRQQAERAQRDAAARQQRDAAEQQRRSQGERQQRQQAERQRDAAVRQQQRPAQAQAAPRQGAQAGEQRQAQRQERKTERQQGRGFPGA